MKLNERIRQVRIINKLTAKEFGEIFNISLSSVSLYESGRRTPSIDLIIKISDHFNISTDYLLGITDIPFTKPPKNKLLNKYDIAENIENVVQQIENREELFFNGKYVDSEFICLIKKSIRNLIETFYFFAENSTRHM